MFLYTGHVKEPKRSIRKRARGLYPDLLISDSFSLMAHTIYAESTEGPKSYKIIIILSLLEKYRTETHRLIDCMFFFFFVFFSSFSIVFQFYRGGQSTHPCFPGVLLNCAPHNILEKELSLMFFTKILLINNMSCFLLVMIFPVTILLSHNKPLFPM